MLLLFAYTTPYTLALSGFAGPPVLSDFIALAVGALDSDDSFTSSVVTCVFGFLLRISEPSANIRRRTPAFDCAWTFLTPF